MNDSDDDNTGFGYAVYNLCIACGSKISIRRNVVSNYSRECYFYLKGNWGKILINVCSETTSPGCGASSDFYTQMTQPNINFFLRIACFFAMISVFTGAILFVPVLLICFSVVFLLAWAGNNFFAFDFWGIEKTWLLIRSIYAICPACNRRVNPRLSSKSTNEPCKKFLSDNGLPEIVSLIDNHFNIVNDFAVSCTGGKPDGSAFTPTGIERLWEWILK